MSSLPPGDNGLDIFKRQNLNNIQLKLRIYFLMEFLPRLTSLSHGIGIGNGSFSEYCIIYLQDADILNNVVDMME